MNGFHVHAVGWVLIFNARALSPREARELSALWAALGCAHAHDKRQAPALLRLMASRSLPLSQESRGALRRLLDRMVALHPERFGWPALRRHRNQWALQSGLSLLLGVLAAAWLPSTLPFARQLDLTLFLLGLILIVPTLTLWRAASAVRCATGNRHEEWPGLQWLARHSTQGEEARDRVVADSGACPQSETPSGAARTVGPVRSP